MSEYQYLNEVQEVCRRLGKESQAFSDTRILISGGGGFLGQYFQEIFRYLNQEVLLKPCHVTICENYIVHSVIPPQPDNPHVTYMRHDVIQPLNLKEKVDYIIHAAGIASPFYYRKYPLETLEVSTTGTKNLLTLALHKEVKGFLYFSSSEIYGDPDPKYVPTPESYRGYVSCMGPRACYDESKRVGETLCSVYNTLYGLPTKWVRPFNVYGPGMREMDYRVLPNFASRIIGGKPMNVYGHGNQTRTFCFITDAMLGFILTLIKGLPGEAYNVGNPSPEVSMMQLVKTLEKVEGRSLAVNTVEYPDSYPADEPQRRCPDIKKASIHLGFQPEVDLEQGLERFMRWAKTTYRGVQV